MCFGLTIGNNKTGTTIWVNPSATGNIVIPRRTLEEKGIDMYAGQQIKKRKPTYDKNTYKVLNNMLMEYINVMEDQGRFHLRPKGILRQDDVHKRAEMWAEDFETYFREKMTD